MLESAATYGANFFPSAIESPLNPVGRSDRRWVSRIRPDGTTPVRGAQPRRDGPRRAVATPPRSVVRRAAGRRQEAHLPGSSPLRSFSLDLTVSSTPSPTRGLALDRHRDRHPRVGERGELDLGRPDDDLGVDRRRRRARGSAPSSGLLLTRWISKALRTRSSSTTNGLAPRGRSTLASNEVRRARLAPRVPSREQEEQTVDQPAAGAARALGAAAELALRQQPDQPARPVRPWPSPRRRRRRTAGRRGTPSAGRCGCRSPVGQTTTQRWQSMQSPSAGAAAAACLDSLPRGSPRRAS